MRPAKGKRVIFFTRGAIAQLVEQRTENPCVAGSIPAGTTLKPETKVSGFFVFNNFAFFQSTIAQPPLSRYSVFDFLV